MDEDVQFLKVDRHQKKKKNYNIPNRKRWNKGTKNIDHKYLLKKLKNIIYFFFLGQTFDTNIATKWFVHKFLEFLFKYSFLFVASL